MSYGYLQLPSIHPVLLPAQPLELWSLRLSLVEEDLPRPDELPQLAHVRPEEVHVIAGQAGDVHLIEYLRRLEAHIAPEGLDTPRHIAHQAFSNERPIAGGKHQHAHGLFRGARPLRASWLMAGFHEPDGLHVCELGEEAGSGWNPSEKVRLFPNGQRICFENPIHELVEPTLGRAKIPIRKCPVPVHHYGMLNRDKTSLKKEFYYGLGRKKVSRGNGQLSGLVECAIQSQEIGEYGEALNIWNDVLQRAPDMALAYFNMSYACIQLEKYDEGGLAASRAMELDAGLKEAVLNYALCQLRTGKVEGALECLSGFLSNTPGHPMATGLLAVADCIAGRKDTGLALFDDLRTMGFNCPEYIREHARKLQSAGRRQDALRLLESISHSQHADEAIQSLMRELL